jgi:hypothetical protein
MLEKKSIYLKPPLKKERKILEELTTGKNWGSAQFDKVMVQLGILGNGQAIPAENRPENIELEKYRPYFENLVGWTKATARELSQTFFVDKEKNILVPAEKFPIGTKTEVDLYVSGQPKDFIGSMHTHPTNNLDTFPYALSGGDYKTFISDTKQQFMIVICGERVKILILKTSVTPNNMSPERVTERVSALEEEFGNFGGFSSLEQLVFFNQMVCVEFGLTFFLSDKKDSYNFSRMNVVDVIDEND